MLVRVNLESKARAGPTLYTQSLMCNGEHSLLPKLGTLVSRTDPNSRKVLCPQMSKSDQLHHKALLLSLSFFIFYFLFSWFFGFLFFYFFSVPDIVSMKLLFEGFPALGIARIIPACALDDLPKALYK